MQHRETLYESGGGSERMRVIHGARREAMAREGYKLQILSPIDAAPTPVDALAAQARQCLEAQRGLPELRGLVLVLAPSQLEDGDAFGESVRRLADAPELESVRFVVIELGENASAPLTRRFGSAAMTTSCLIDTKARDREATELMEALGNTPSGASPEVQAGGAGPKDVCAPPRFGKPPHDAVPPPDVLAQLDLGPSAALVGPAGHALKRRVYAAAAALQKGQFGDAVRLQGEARDQCYGLGLVQIGLILEIGLGTYLVAASVRRSARKTFEQAAVRAEASHFPALAAQALLGAANLCALDRDWPDAAIAANRAAHAAETADETALAIEAYRCAGQFALRGGSEKAAVDRWRRALNLAKAAPPEVSRRSSVSVVARALAKVMIDNGAEAAAAALLQEADDYERGTPRKKGKKAPHVGPTGTEAMGVPLAVRKPTDAEIVELVKPEAKSVTPSGTEVLREPLVRRTDVRR